MEPNPGGGLLLHRHVAPLTRRYMAYFCSGVLTRVLLANIPGARAELSLPVQTSSRTSPINCRASCRRMTFMGVHMVGVLPRQLPLHPRARQQAHTERMLARAERRSRQAAKQVGQWKARLAELPRRCGGEIGKALVGRSSGAGKREQSRTVKSRNPPASAFQLQCRRFESERPNDRSGNVERDAEVQSVIVLTTSRSVRAH